MGDVFKNTSGSNNSMTSLMNSLSNFSNNGSSSVNPTEDPMFASFRQSLLPAIAGQYTNAQKDVYGPAQVAQVANQSNQGANAAIQGQTSADARSGRFNSGVSSANSAATRAGATSNVTGFEAQLPFLNQQAKMNNTNNLLGLATNFLGRAPIGQTSTSKSAGSSSTDQNSSGTQKTDQWGNPSIWQDILGGAGAAAAFIP